LQEIRSIETAKLISTRKVAENTFVTRFRSPRIAAGVRAGQFIMVSFPNCVEPLLARAFSVSDVQGGNLSILYTAIGKGTTRLSRLPRGGTVLLNGPLGRGFPQLSKGQKIWVVAGGSGAALVPILLREAKRAGALTKFFYGARVSRQLVKFGNLRCYYATDDGSKGYHGTVVDLLNEHLRREMPDSIYGCGPTAMLLALQRSSVPESEVYISVETPMACGMGFCQGCPVKIKNSEGYLLACKDGPVFNAKEIELG
jgi:dihydroorotate dehydrogenase electron transfer subunit